MGGIDSDNSTFLENLKLKICKHIFLMLSAEKFKTLKHKSILNLLKKAIYYSWNFVCTQNSERIINY